LVDDDAFEETRVLLPHRPVEADLLADALDLVGWALGAADQPGRLGGHQEEDDVRHHGHGDEKHAGPEQPSDEVPVHLSTW
jgi:hypothetical protein